MPQHHQSDPRPEPSACSLWQRDVQPCQPMQTNTRVPTHAPRGLAGAVGASDTIRAPPGSLSLPLPRGAGSNTRRCRPLRRALRAPPSSSARALWAQQPRLPSGHGREPSRSVPSSSVAVPRVGSAVPPGSVQGRDPRPAPPPNKPARGSEHANACARAPPLLAPPGLPLPCAATNLRRSRRSRWSRSPRGCWSCRHRAPSPRAQRP